MSGLIECAFSHPSLSLGRSHAKPFPSPYALQWMWPLPLFIGVWFAPESPWWLVRRGRIEDAKKSLLRLTSVDRETDFDADETVAMMVHTTALEEKVICLLVAPPPFS